MLRNFFLLVLFSCLFLTSCEQYTNPAVSSIPRTLMQMRHSSSEKISQTHRLLTIWQGDHRGYAQLFWIGTPRLPDSAHNSYERLGWYTPTNVNIELCEGQLCGSTGSTQAWRDVAISNLPNISQLLSGTIIDWKRSYILMPGYHSKDQQLRTEPDNNPKPRHLYKLGLGNLRWFKTHSINHPDGTPETLLGIDPITKKVLYSDTCLSETYCFSWQTSASSSSGNDL